MGFGVWMQGRTDAKGLQLLLHVGLGLGSFWHRQDVSQARGLLDVGAGLPHQLIELYKQL